MVYTGTIDPVDASPGPVIETESISIVMRWAAHQARNMLGPCSWDSKPTLEWLIMLLRNSCGRKAERLKQTANAHSEPPFDLKAI